MHMKRLRPEPRRLGPGIRRGQTPSRKQLMRKVAAWRSGTGAGQGAGGGAGSKELQWRRSKAALLLFIKQLAKSPSMLFSSAPAPCESTAKYPPSLVSTSLKCIIRCGGADQPWHLWGPSPALTSRTLCWSQLSGCCGWYP